MPSRATRVDASDLMAKHPGRWVQGNAAIQQMQVGGAHTTSDDVDHDVGRFHCR